MGIAAVLIFCAVADFWVNRAIRAYDRPTSRRGGCSNR
jgi:hypothetical protein